MYMTEGFGKRLLKILQYVVWIGLSENHETSFFKYEGTYQVTRFYYKTGYNIYSNTH